jgi:hypothetical protein
MMRSVERKESGGHPEKEVTGYEEEKSRMRTRQHQ